MFPTDPPDGRMLDSMLRRRSRTHAGYVLGWTTTGSHVPTFLVGRRYFWEVPSRYAPDVLAGVDLRIGLFHVRPTRGFRGGGFDSRLTIRF
jgi:hypothetical protein